MKERRNHLRIRFELQSQSQSKKKTTKKKAIKITSQSFHYYFELNRKYNRINHNESITHNVHMLIVSTASHGMMSDTLYYIVRVRSLLR